MIWGKTMEQCQEPSLVKLKPSWPAQTPQLKMELLGQAVLFKNKIKWTPDFPMSSIFQAHTSIPFFILHLSSRLHPHLLVLLNRKLTKCGYPNLLSEATVSKSHFHKMTIMKLGQNGLINKKIKGKWPNLIQILFKSGIKYH